MEGTRSCFDLNLKILLPEVDQDLCLYYERIIYQLGK